MSNIGKTVKVKDGYTHRCPEGREDNKTAVIILEGFNGEGSIRVDRDLNGCLYWNLDVLEIAD